MSKLNVSRLIETTYENDTYWVEYIIDECTVGYEIVDYDDFKDVPITVTKEEIRAGLEEYHHEVKDKTFINQLMDDEKYLFISSLTESAKKYYEAKYNEKELLQKIITKPSLQDCSDPLGVIIQECRYSENEMFFVERGEMSTDLLESVRDEVNKFGIDDYVKFYEDGCLITVYGGVITQFLFEV